MKHTNILIISGIFACMMVVIGLYIVFSDFQEHSPSMENHSIENPEIFEKPYYDTFNNSTVNNKTIIPINVPNETISIAQNDTDTNNSSNPKFMETTEKQAQEKKEYKFYSYNRTTEPKFIVGEEYIYEIFDNSGNIMPHPKDNIMLPSNFTMNIIVEKFKKTKDSGCFLIHQPETKVMTFVMSTSSTKQVPILFVFGGKNCIDKESGEFVSLKSIEEEDVHRALPILLWQFYQPWMLYLQEDMRWTEYNGTLFGSDMKTGKDVEIGSGSKEYIVKGIEKVNGRECFQVEVTTKQYLKRTNAKISQREYFCIDINKRIIVRYKWYEDNVLAMKMELIQINSAPKN